VANTLLGGNLQLTKCEKIDAYAPAEAELVLEGKISFDREAEEGPFVDITGTYDIKRTGLPREAAIYNAVSQVVPRVNAVNLSVGGCGWLHAVISIEKQMDGDSKNALLAAFAGHPSLKHVVVVDSDIDVFNLQEVEWAIALRFQSKEDLIVIPNARGSTLDPSADQEKGLTSKMGIDATRPLSAPAENFRKATIPTSKRAAETVKKILGLSKK